VGKSKTDAGTGRVIPLNETVLIALRAHAAWYIRRFKECKPDNRYCCILPFPFRLHGSLHSIKTATPTHRSIRPKVTADQQS
jgi:hypothetical protein